jgi:hypothetical protein
MVKKCHGRSELNLQQPTPAQLWTLQRVVASWADQEIQPNTRYVGVDHIKYFLHFKI